MSLKDKIKNFKNIKYQGIQLKNAITSIDLQENDIILITGSLYLAGRSFKFKLNIFFNPSNNI